MFRCWKMTLRSLRLKKKTESESLIVLANFYEQETSADLSTKGYDVLLQNYPDVLTEGDSIRLRPFETVVFYRSL